MLFTRGIDRQAQGWHSGELLGAVCPSSGTGQPPPQLTTPRLWVKRGRYEIMVKERAFHACSPPTHGDCPYLGTSAARLSVVGSGGSGLSCCLQLSLIN